MKYFIIFLLLGYAGICFSASLKNDTINDFVYVEKTIWLGKNEKANKIQIDLNQLEIKELAERLRRRLISMQADSKTILFREIPLKTDFNSTSRVFSQSQAKNNLGKTVFFDMNSSPKIWLHFQTLPEWALLTKIKKEVENQVSKKSLRSLASIGRLRMAALKDLEKRNQTPRFYDYITAHVKEASIITLKELLKSETQLDRLLSAFSLAYLGDDSGKAELLNFAKLENASSSLTPASVEIFYTKAGLILLETPVPGEFAQRHSAVKELETAIEDALKNLF